MSKRVERPKSVLGIGVVCVWLTRGQQRSYGVLVRGDFKCRLLSVIFVC